MHVLKFFHSKKGQTATEYMLILAVIVIGLVATASQFIPKFKSAVGKLGDNVSTWVSKDQTMMDSGGGDE